MPSFRQHSWNSYKLQLIPAADDSDRRFIHFITRRKFESLPYFWGADIRFDLVVTVPEHHDSKTIITYNWILCKEDGTELSNGEDTVQFCKVKNSLQPRKAGDIIRTINHPLTMFMKADAINLGWLTEISRYEVKVKFTTNTGISSGYLANMAIFTLQDRDNFYSNVWEQIAGALFNALFGAVAGAIAGLITVLIVK